MARPTTCLSSKSFSLSSPNPPFKIFGDNLDIWPLLAVKLHSNHASWPTPTVLTVTKHFIQLRANPTPLAAAPAAAPAAGGGPAPAAVASSDDLTITLTFEDPATGAPEDIVEESQDIEYVP